MTVRLAAVAAVLLMSLACGPRGPVLGASTPPNVGGTISGMVSANDGSSAVSARKVTAVNTDTGARFEGSTSINGGYTIQVPVGTYRLEVELQAGEVVATQPDTTQINRGDLDSGRNFVVTRR